MEKQNPSRREWVELISILLFGSVGVGLAYLNRDIRYVSEAVGCSHFVAAFIAVTMCSSGLKGLRGRLLTIGIIVVVVTSAASAIILLNDANKRLVRDNSALQYLSRQLSDKNAKLGILEVINREPRLVASEVGEINECFEPNAIIIAVSGEKKAWSGIDGIVGRYNDMSSRWRLISMHACPEFHEIKNGHALVTATTYLYEPGRNEKWRPALSEVWKLHRGSDGRWRISAFYYGISPKDIDKYL